ncbi:pyrroline-5-carboxylate reductase dimerization domain-containing protein [Streptomyces albidoflavus]|uniref:pyrroline-5-carboxylate reductase dimerization domain-containing protein n=1 Tax=Streptomyces albidoflavus TaxID=1886 RepID=UPI0038D0C07B
MTRSEQSETLVIGATGKTGRRVARRLTALGAPVRPGSRKAPRPFDWEDPGTAGAGGHLGRVRRLLPGPGHARVGAGPPLLSGPSTACCSSATRTRPAFVLHLAEAMIEAGAVRGVPCDLAPELVTRVLTGSAAWLRADSREVATLREKVCAPGGAGIRRIAALDRHAVRAAVVSALGGAPPGLP